MKTIFNNLTMLVAIVVEHVKLIPIIAPVTGRVVNVEDIIIENVVKTEVGEEIQQVHLQLIRQSEPESTTGMHILDIH